MSEMIPSQPYLLRAVYEWIVDNNLTPHLIVDAERDAVVVPIRYVEDGKIVLNVSPSAVQELLITNTAVSFAARFQGTRMDVTLPTSAVIAIYARENGEGIIFSEFLTQSGSINDEKKSDIANRPNLRIVKSPGD